MENPLKNKELRGYIGVATKGKEVITLNIKLKSNG